MFSELDAQRYAPKKPRLRRGLTRRDVLKAVYLVGTVLTVIAIYVGFLKTWQ